MRLASGVELGLMQLDSLRVYLQDQILSLCENLAMPVVTKVQTAIHLLISLAKMEP